MLRLLVTCLGCLGLWALAGCGAAPRSMPAPPPPGFADALPPDAPLTAVLRPVALRAALVDLGLGPTIAMRGPDPDPVEPIAGLGIDARQPVWLSLRAGPVLGVLRAAEDAERVLADVDPMIDPRLSPGAPFAPGPLRRWLDAHPLPPAWIHLRLVGRPAPGPDGAAIDPGAWLNATQGALAVTRATDPAETLAATLDAEAGPAGAIQAALAGIEPTVYRLLDRPLPTVVIVHRIGGAEPAMVVDVIWDRDLGPGGLVAGMAALPEAGGVWTQRRAARFGWPAEEELLRVGVHHEGWLAAGRMLREVQAMQAVIGQGSIAPGTRRTLTASRAEARLPQTLAAPVARALIETTMSVVRGDDRLRVRLGAATPSAAFAALRDGTAPVDHGIAANGLPTRGPGVALTLAHPPAGVGRVLGPHIGPPDRPLPALIESIERCGPACIPALWSVLAYARDLPATIAAVSGHAPLEAALAEATGAAGLWIGDHWAAAVGHRAPATLARAAWSPIVDAAGLSSRWLVGDRAVMVAGRADPLEVLNRAARSPAVTDAGVLRFTAVGQSWLPEHRRLRFDGALSFDRGGVALDVVIDRRPPPQ